jgi:hypothetical protein
MQDDPGINDLPTRNTVEMAYWKIFGQLLARIFGFNPFLFAYRVPLVVTYFGFARFLSISLSVLVLSHVFASFGSHRIGWRILAIMFYTMFISNTRILVTT